MRKQLRKRPACRLWVSFLFLYLSAPAWAQLYSGSLSGIVLDPSNAPVMGARVTLIDAERSTHAEIKTDSSGRYLFRSLSPGSYLLDVEAEGFEPCKLDVAIGVNTSLSAEARLHLTARRETVLVQEPPSQINVEDATIGLTLSRNLINDLPLINRNPFDLAFLAPGVSQAPGAAYGNPVGTPGFITNFVSDGSRNAQADVLLDGVSVMNSDNNPGVQKAIYVPPVEAIQEFRIQQTNFAAEFGNSGGTIVNVVTRSGTNQLHGELFEFLRNNVSEREHIFRKCGGPGATAFDA